jgi:hypothetical protein
MRGFGVLLVVVVATIAFGIPAPQAQKAASPPGYQDVLFFDILPGGDNPVSAVWNLTRTPGAGGELLGEYSVDLRELGAWRGLLRESWRGTGGVMAIASRPSLEVKGDRDRDFSIRLPQSDLNASFGRPIDTPLGTELGTLPMVQAAFRKVVLERAGLKHEGWAAHETMIGDAGAKKIERIALWDFSGSAMYFSLTDDKVRAVARVDSAGTVTQTATAIVRWGESAQDTASKRDLPRSWNMSIAAWQWQAAIVPDGTAFVAGSPGAPARMLQRVTGTATGPKGAHRVKGIVELTLR